MNTSVLFIIVILFNCGFTKEVTIDRCVNEEILTNGCSIPGKIPFPYEDFFLPACQRHDLCYTCGHKYGWQRTDCDDGFRNNMEYLCLVKEKLKAEQSSYTWQSFKDFLKELKGSFLVGKGLVKWSWLKTGSLDHCLNGVQIYYDAVRHFSMKHFHLKPIKQCNWDCAELMSNPTIGLNVTQLEE